MVRVIPLIVALVLGFVVLTVTGVTAEIVDNIWIAIEQAPDFVHGLLLIVGVMVAVTFSMKVLISLTLNPGKTLSF